MSKLRIAFHLWRVSVLAAILISAACIVAAGTDRFGAMLEPGTPARGVAGVIMFYALFCGPLLWSGIRDNFGFGSGDYDTSAATASATFSD